MWGGIPPDSLHSSTFLIVVLRFILFLNWNCSANNLNGICINWAQSCQSCDRTVYTHCGSGTRCGTWPGNGQARKLNRFCVQDKSLVNWITLARNPFTGNYPTSCATPTLLLPLPFSAIELNFTHMCVYTIWTIFNNNNNNTQRGIPKSSQKLS